MKKIYFALWWLWPIIFVGIDVAQDRLGRGVFGFWVIPFSLITVLGSLLTGTLGVALFLQKRIGVSMLVTVAIAFAPLVCYLLLLLK